MSRRLLFIGTGVTFAANFVVTASLHPDYQRAESLADWVILLSFTAAGLLLAASVTSLARSVGDKVVARVAGVATVGGIVIGVSNLIEDGLHVEALFYVTAIGLLVTDVGLLALAIVLLWRGMGRERWLAVAPLVTLAVILAVHGIAGAALVLCGWTLAAIVVNTGGRSLKATSPTL